MHRMLFVVTFSRLTSQRRNAPVRAKSDLQKQLVTCGVRKSIANAILSGIGLGDAEPVSTNRPISRAERPISVMSTRSHVRDLVDDGMLAKSMSQGAALMIIKNRSLLEADRDLQEVTTIDQRLLQKPQ